MCDKKIAKLFRLFLFSQHFGQNKDKKSQFNSLKKKNEWICFPLTWLGEKIFRTKKKKEKEERKI